MKQARDEVRPILLATFADLDGVTRRSPAAVKADGSRPRPQTGGKSTWPGLPVPRSSPVYGVSQSLIPVIDIRWRAAFGAARDLYRSGEFSHLTSVDILADPGEYRPARITPRGSQKCPGVRAVSRFSPEEPHIRWQPCGSPRIGI